MHTASLLPAVLAHPLKLSYPYRFDVSSMSTGLGPACFSGTFPLPSGITLSILLDMMSCSCSPRRHSSRSAAIYLFSMVVSLLVLGCLQGKITTLGGVTYYVATPIGDYAKDKALLLLPDVFGMQFINNQVLRIFSFPTVLA
jgi:hypothetical protein